MPEGAVQKRRLRVGAKADEKHSNLLPTTNMIAGSILHSVLVQGRLAVVRKFTPIFPFVIRWRNLTGSCRRMAEFRKNLQFGYSELAGKGLSTRI